MFNPSIPGAFSRDKYLITSLILALVEGSSSTCKTSLLVREEIRSRRLQVGSVDPNLHLKTSKEWLVWLDAPCIQCKTHFERERCGYVLI